MEMILKKKDKLQIIEDVNQDTSWEELADIINFATALQGKALEVAINKGLAEGITEGEIIEKLRDAGCTLKDRQLYQLVKFHSFKIELSFSAPVHSDLKEPETEAQFRGLEGGSAQEKLEMFNDVSGGESATRDQVQAAKNLIREAEEAAKVKIKKKPQGQLPKYLTPDEMNDFDEWFEKKTGKKRKDTKPKVDFKKLIENRTLILDVFTEKVDDWKKARKILLNLTHPDKGGSPIAFQFIETLDKLMRQLQLLLDYGKYRTRIHNLKIEWWNEYTKEEKK